MIRTIARIGAIITFCGLAAGCAQESRSQAMVADVQAGAILAETSTLRNAVGVDAVSGGTETDPAWTSQVSTGAFRQALELSLKQHTMLGGQGAPLNLTATIKDIDQPLIGVSMTVTATVQYTITDAAGQTTFDETIATPYTAAFGDALLGAKRLQLANEGAVKANIKRFIDRVIADEQANPGKYGAPALSSLRLRLG